MKLIPIVYSKSPGYVSLERNIGVKRKKTELSIAHRKEVLENKFREKHKAFAKHLTSVSKPNAT